MEPKDVVNVLRDTHRSLEPGGELLDFHPTFPPFSRVEAGGRAFGPIEEPDFPDQLRATEAGMREAERLGLFRRVAAESHEIGEHYDEVEELIDAWELEGDLETRLRAVTGPVRVVSKVVFRLYRAV
jgi:hypothetical protein